MGTSVPGLPIRDCAESCNSSVPRCVKVYTIDVMMQKTIFECLYLVQGLKTLDLRVKCPYNRFRRWIGPNQEKSDIFKPSRFEPLYQPYFGFWLFAWSRCGRIVKKSNRKDSLQQDYLYYLRRHLHRVVGSRRHLCPKSPETFESKLGLFWLKHRSPSVLVIYIDLHYFL